MYTAYEIFVYDSMPLLIAAVNAALDTKQPIGAPFINHQTQWCQAMGTVA